MRRIDNRSDVPLLEQAKEVLTEAFEAPFNFDLNGEAFKIILESWGDDKVDKSFADKVKTMLKIRFGLFGTDIALSMGSNNPNSAIFFDTYVLINSQDGTKKKVLALNIKTGKIDEQFEGDDAAQQAYQSLFHKSMTQSITDSTRRFAGNATVEVITFGEEKKQ